MTSRQMWGLRCTKCEERYETLLTKADLDLFLDDEDRNQSECCSSPLARCWDIGGIKMNFTGATRKGIK